MEKILVPLCLSGIFSLATHKVMPLAKGAKTQRFIMVNG